MCCRFPLEKPVCMLFWKLGLLWGWCLMFHFIVALSAHWSGKRPLEGSAPSHPAQSRVSVSLDQAFPIQVLKIKKSSRMEFLQPSRDTCSITSLPESSVISPGLRHFACIFHEPFWATSCAYVTSGIAMHFSTLVMCNHTIGFAQHFNVDREREIETRTVLYPSTDGGWPFLFISWASFFFFWVLYPRMNAWKSFLGFRWSVLVATGLIWNNGKEGKKCWSQKLSKISEMGLASSCLSCHQILLSFFFSFLITLAMGYAGCL